MRSSGAAVGGRLSTTCSFRGVGPGEHRLAAIVIADVVGYSAMMEHDEPGTLSRLFALQAQVIEPAISAHAGRVVKTTGDGVLAEFTSVASAVDAAVAIQRGITEWPDVGEPLRLRIGIHVGEVLARDGDIYGDAVNIAARLEQAADAGGILLSKAGHDQLADRTARQFEEAGPLSLKNISRDVQALRWAPGKRITTNPPRRLSKPTIAVLPFENLSSGDDQEFFADGLVEDLISMLSRFHWFRVTSRGSSFSMRGEGADAVEAGRRLGARHIVTGSVRRSGSRVRVAAQLIDTQSASQSWGDRFDRDIHDLFDLQDEIVRAIVGAVVPQFVSSFRDGPGQRHRSSVPSWELAMQGWNLAWRLDGSPDTIASARAVFEQAIAADPDNALAYSGLAFCYANPFYQAQVDRDIPKAIEAARRATAIDDKDAFAWCMLGAAVMYGNDLDQAERHLKRAISINPSLALAHGFMAAVSMWRGESGAADLWFGQCRELSPLDPMLPFAALAPSMSRFAEGDYAGALAKIDEAIGLDDLPSAWRMRAAAFEMMGAHDRAAAAVARMQALGEVDMAWLRSNLTPFVDPEAWDRYLGALQRAGVPETIDGSR